MIKITDKAFRYTPSYNTDLKKTFKKAEQAVRASAAENTATEPATKKSVVAIRVVRQA